MSAKNARKLKKRNARQEVLTAKQKIRREFFAWFWVAFIFLLINGTVGQARVIPSGSMENTLLVGDHLIMSRVGYDAGVPFTPWHVPLCKNPQRQQMIIFRPPISGDRPDWIKRVIGMPGETVDIHDGAVWVNGQKLKENYTIGRTERLDDPFSVVTFPYHVPENCYFAMGDNREDSYDSRVVGCVPRKNLIGIPVMIYMSLNARSTNAWESRNFGERFFAYADAVLHPGTVRWSRLFHTF